MAAALAKPRLQLLEVEPVVVGRPVRFRDNYMKLLPQLEGGAESPLAGLTDCRRLLLPAAKKVMPRTRSAPVI